MDWNTENIAKKIEGTLFIHNFRSSRVKDYRPISLVLFCNLAIYCQF